jgi:hypothetical protein
MKSRFLGATALAIAVLSAGRVGDVWAGSESGAISLFIDPSVRAAGMGDASNAVFWGGDPNYWSNPALLSYHEGLRWEWGKTQLVPGLANDVFFKTNRVTLARWGVGLALAGRPWDGFGGTRLDYGTSIATNESGQEIGTFSSYEDVSSWGLAFSMAQLSDAVLRLGDRPAPSFSRYADVAFGLNSKKTVVSLAPASVLRDPSAGDAVGRVHTYDLGMLVRLSPYNSVDGPGYLHGLDAALAPITGGIRLDLSYGTSRLNDDDKWIWFLDAAQADPIARESHHSWAARAATGFPTGWGSRLEGRGLGWFERMLTPFFSLGYARDRSRESIGNGPPAIPDIERSGWELTLGNVFSLRHGRVDDRAGDVRGESSGFGLGIELVGIAGIRYDRATIPQATDLSRVHRNALSVHVDGFGLWGALHRKPQVAGSGSR